MNPVKLSRFVALAISVAAIAPAHAAPGSVSDITDMPFVKASAYMSAINEWCFPVVPLKNRDLYYAAKTQREFGYNFVLEDAAETASAHLRGDQNACAPAQAFVQRTIAAMPETVAILNNLKTEIVGDRAIAEGEALYQEQQAAEAKVQAIAAAKEAERKRAEEQAAAMKAAKVESCIAMTNAKTVPGDVAPYAQIAVASARKNLLPNCTGILTALQIDEAEKITADLSARGERGKAAIKAELDKIAEENQRKHKK